MNQVLCINQPSLPTGQGQKDSLIPMLTFRLAFHLHVGGSQFLGQYLRLTLHLWVLRIVLGSVMEALDCSCWPSAENWYSWLLRRVKLSPLKTKHKITNRAQLSTAKSVREEAPGELVCLSSLGAFWKTHTFLFHPHAKSRNISHVLFTQEERTISINGCI